MSGDVIDLLSIDHSGCPSMDLAEYVARLEAKIAKETAFPADLWAEIERREKSRFWKGLLDG